MCCDNYRANKCFIINCLVVGQGYILRLHFFLTDNKTSIVIMPIMSFYIHSFLRNAEVSRCKSRTDTNN